MIDHRQLYAEYRQRFDASDEAVAIVGSVLSLDEVQYARLKILESEIAISKKVNSAKSLLLKRIVIQAVASAASAFASFCTQSLLLVGRIGARLLLNPYVLGGLALAGLGYVVYENNKERIKELYQKARGKLVDLGLLEAEREATVIDGSPVIYDESMPEAPIAEGKGNVDAIMRNQSALQAVAEGARIVGIDPYITLSITKAESAFGGLTSNSMSSARGILQITKSTWNSLYPRFNKKYGIPKNDRSDPLSAAIFSSAYIKDILYDAVKSVKSDPDLTDIYMTYVFGASGGKRLISACIDNPNQYGADIMGSAQVKANPNLFYKNGVKLTVSETRNLLKSRIALTSMESIALDKYVVKNNEEEESKPMDESKEKAYYIQSPMHDRQFVIRKVIYEV